MYPPTIGVSMQGANTDVVTVDEVVETAEKLAGDYEVGESALINALCDLTDFEVPTIDRPVNDTMLLAEHVEEDVAEVVSDYEAFSADEGHPLMPLLEGLVSELVDQSDSHRAEIDRREFEANHQPPY